MYTAIYWMKENYTPFNVTVISKYIKIGTGWQDSLTQSQSETILELTILIQEDHKFRKI